MKNIIAIVNQKGGVGKTTSTHNIGVGLAKRGYKVLCVDSDPQGSLTAVMGCAPTKIEIQNTLAGMIAMMDDKGECDYDCILQTSEGIDLIPANNSLNQVQAGMLNMYSRERILTRILAPIQDQYDYILIDGQPSMNTLTVNALAVATDILIPVQPMTQAALGLSDLLLSAKKTRSFINPNLRIAGIFFTMANPRTKQYKTIRSEIEQAYGEHIRIFDTLLPQSVKTDEADYEGKSLLKYMPRNSLAIAYDNLVEEILECLN